MALPLVNVLSLCSGVGALDLGIRLAVPEARTICYVEREAPCVETLVERFEDGSLHEAPVYSDLCTFDAGAWRGCVDLVASGIPCQPYSFAGQRKGNNDERALWPELVRIVRECKPAAVFIENTPGFIHHAEPLWRELQGLGFEWAPPIRIRAKEFGANHRRNRLFLFAAHPKRLQLREQSWWSSGQSRGRKAEFIKHSESPWGHSEPDLCRVDDGPPHRVDRLRALGNGVVPIVAAYAFRVLAGDLLK